MKIIIVGGNAGAKIAAEIFTINFPHCDIFYAETYLEREKETQVVSDYKKVPDLLREGGYEYFIATGDNFQRAEIYKYIYDCKVRNFAQISPNATLCGRVSVGEYCFIGAGSTIIPNKQISNKSVVAAGSVVIDYISQNVMVAGVPAKIKKKDYHEI